MFEIAKGKTENIATINSREVAEMLEMKEHSKLIRKIDGISTVLTEAKIGVSEYWIESTYKDKSGRSNRCFNVTKKGCEMLAHKSTGDKGVIFTHKYMKKIDEMEEALKETEKPQLPTTYLDALKALVVAEEEKQAILEQKNILQEETVELKKEVEHKSDVIAGFTEDIDLASKRQRINQIIRFNTGKYQERYALLYSEFEKKHHIDLNKRMKSKETLKIKPKIQNKLDFIDRVLHMTNELFEIAVTLFEADYKIVLEKIEGTR